MDNETRKHILEGEVRTKAGGVKKPVGFHYEGDAAHEAKLAVKGTKIVAGTDTSCDPRGVYEAKVTIEGLSKNKSTFFPRHWTPEQIDTSINQAWFMKKAIPGTSNGFEGRSTSGVLIRMYLRNDGSGIIDSAFPVYNK
jgi:hypothetical protein